MSLDDGNLVNEMLYTTSDKALAAYLMMRGYEYLGAIDNGRRNQRGITYYDFGLTHTDPYVLANMWADIQSKADEYQNQFLSLPSDSDARVNFQTFYRNLKKLQVSLDEPIRRPD